MSCRCISMHGCVLNTRRVLMNLMHLGFSTESEREGTCRDNQRIFWFELVPTLAGLVTFLSETRPVQETFVLGEAHLAPSQGLVRRW